MSSIFVVIATVGRAKLTKRTVALLGRQTRVPDGIIVVGVAQGDIEGIVASDTVRVVLAERGSCRQRNHAMDMIGGDADIVTFFDDDFIPAENYLEEVERIFSERSDIVGVTGELIADGINSGGFTLEKALDLVRDGAAGMDPKVQPREALYGCNMSVRMSAVKGLHFDENLPLYGWQEDIDFTYQLGRSGPMISTGKVTGVHIGARGGRTFGKRPGYSQVANIVYLHRKGTLPPGVGQKLLFGNLVSNVVRSAWPEPHVDRRGRLLGNLIAISDVVRGRVDPRRIERM